MGQLNTNFICLGVVLSYARSCQTGHNDSNSNFNCDCGSNSSCWCDFGSAPTWEHIISLCHFNQTTNSSRCPLLSLSLYLAHPSPLLSSCWPGLPLHIFAIQRKAYLTLPLALLRQACGMLAFPLFTPPSSALFCTLGLASISSRHRFDTSAARQFKWRTRRGSVAYVSKL